MQSTTSKKSFFWVIVAFVVVILTAMTMSVWWNVLIVQNHEILKKVTENVNAPLAIWLIIGILCSVVTLLGLLFLFIKLIQSLRLNLAQNLFISAVTHELKSPLASLQVLHQTLKDKELPQSKRGEFEVLFEHELKRLRQTVDRVLDTARLENQLSHFHSKHISTESIELKELLETLCTDFKPMVVSLGGSLNLKSVKIIKVNVNRALLTNALNNIFENALKYSGKAPKIEVKYFKKGKMAFIEITDSGIGLSVKDSKKIFKRFYRVGSPFTQSKEGTGLGLYFSRLAIRAQKGNIRATSGGLGQGTTFIIEIPLAL